MANPEHLAILKQGVAMWNEWRENNPEIRPNLDRIFFERRNLRGIDFDGADLEAAVLSEADLRNASLSGSDLSGRAMSQASLPGAVLIHANLEKADLSGVYLVEANLEGAYLTRANLSGANLGRAKLNSAKLCGATIGHIAVSTDLLFQSTNLRGADLREAVLMGTSLNGVDLAGANLRGAELGETVFADVDLSRVHGLDTVKHNGPSSIGIDTIYLSKGRIPEVFLRGCGVPDTFIEYARSLVGQPIQFYSCFISHSAKDKQFCERLYADLQANGVRVWYFPEDAKWGEPVWGEIDRSIRIYDKLIVVCSKNSLTSGPVLREIERALRREDEEGKNILFPITIGDYIFDEWKHPRKADVLAKVVGDFRGWNRSADKYDAAFKKLLQALKAEQ